jgi:hypothetical protein
VALERHALTYLAPLLRKFRYFGLWCRPQKLEATSIPLPDASFYPAKEGKDLIRGAPRDLHSSPPRSDIPLWFAHDVLHHFTPDDIGSWFDDNPKLDCLAATAVIPPEVAFDLPPLFPDLYTFELTHSSLIYTPEGNSGASYTQRRDCWKWLKAGRISTPQGVCLHVSLLESFHAHHVFLIMRQPLLDDHYRTFDSGGLVAIPFFAAPFTSLANRLTNAKIYENLCMFALRTGEDSTRGLASKLATYAAVNKLPLSQQTAAIDGALHFAISHLPFSIPTFGWRALLFSSSAPIALLAIPSYLFHSLRRSNTSSYIKGHPLRLRTRWWPSTPGLTLRGFATDLCSMGVELLYTPTNASRLASLSIVNCFCGIGLVSKFAFSPLIEAIFRHRALWWPPVRDFLTGFEPTIARLLLAFFAFLAYHYIGFTTTECWFSVENAWHHLWPPTFSFRRLCYATLAMIYRLPSRSRHGTPGGGYGYQLMLTWLFWGTAFPRHFRAGLALHHLPRALDASWRDTYLPTPWLLALPLGFLSVVSLEFLARNFTFSRTTSSLRWKACVTTLLFGVGAGVPLVWLAMYALSASAFLLVATAPLALFGAPLSLTLIVSPFTEWAQFGRSFLFHLEEFSYIPPSRFALYYPSLRTYTLPLTHTHGTPWDERPDPLLALPAPEEPQVPPAPDDSPPPPVSPPLPDEPLPPDVPPFPHDPDLEDAIIANVLNFHGQPALAPYTLDHAGLPYATTINLMRAMPEVDLEDFPDLDPGRCCVWDALSHNIGVGPLTLWANFCASLDDNDLHLFAHGSVPRPRLGNVMTHFGLGSRVFECDNDNEYPAGSEPALVTAPEPGRPTLLLGLQYDVDRDVLHMTARAPRPNRNMRLEGIPHQPEANDERDWADREFLPIGWNNLRIARTIIRGLVNYPNEVWSRTYLAMTGQRNNAAAARCPTLRGAPAPVPILHAPPALPNIALVPQTFMHTLSDEELRRASFLASDLKKFPQVMTSIIDARSLAEELDAAVSAPRRSPVKFTLLHGMAGCGKSHRTKELLRNALREGTSPSEIRILTWHDGLRAQAIDDFMRISPGFNKSTFPMQYRPFLESPGRVLVIDDAGLFPSGFVELLIATSSVEHIIFTFDAAQAGTVFPEATSMSRTTTPTREWLASMSTNYCTTSRRLATETSLLFGLRPPPPIPGHVRTHGTPFIVSKAPHGIPFFAASPRFTNSLANNGVQAIDFSSLQGLTFDGDIAIDLGGLSSGVGDSAIWTALTRSRGTVFLVLGAAMPSPKTLSPTRWGTSTIASAILATSDYYKTSELGPHLDPRGLVAHTVRNHLRRSLPVNLQVALNLDGPMAEVAGATYRQDVHATGPPNVFGFSSARLLVAFNNLSKSSPSREYTALEQPSRFVHRREYLKKMLQDYVSITPETELAPPPRQTEHPLPASDIAPLDPAIGLEEYGSWEDREVPDPVSGLLTNQIREDGSRLPLIHNGGDAATYNISLAKRITPSKEEYALTPREQLALEKLIEGFKVFGKFGDGTFQQGLFDRGARSAYSSWFTRRTRAQLKRALDASPQDWDPKVTNLFLKSETKKKPGVIGGKAKAGQIVTTFPLSKTLRDAPFARYIELAVTTLLPQSTYLHNVPVSELRSWHREFWRSGPTTANDYTAWDRGRNKVFLHFDVYLFRSFGLPEEYIENYIEEKLCTRFYGGPMPPMQFSGDRWTWLLNTLSNMAYTGATMKHRTLDKIPYGTPACFSGDDSLVLGDMVDDPDFPYECFPMEAKPVHSHVGEFCGFRFDTGGVHIASKGLYQRARIAFEQGRNDRGMWDSTDLAARYATQQGYADEWVRRAAQYSLDARRLHGLPPTPFPLSSSPLPSRNLRPQGSLWSSYHPHHRLRHQRLWLSW